MARPTRTNAEYFYHPATFRNDRRVKAIRARYGACGYGLLMMLVELLTDADNITLATDDMELELLAGDLSVPVEEVSSLIQTAEKVGLFTRNELGLLKCPQLDEWLAPVFEKRNRAKNAATAAKLPQPATEIGVSVTETQPVENSTVEYSKGEDNTTSSFQSEVDAPQKKIEPVEVVEPLPESQSNDASHTRGGAADVGTPVEPVKLTKQKGGKELLTGDLAELLNPGGLAERVQKMKSPLTQFEADALVAKYGTAAAQQIVKEMANYAKLTSNNISANLTAHKWLEKRQPAATGVVVVSSYEGRQQHTGVVHPGSVQGRLDTVAQARAELLGQIPA